MPVRSDIIRVPHAKSGHQEFLGDVIMRLHPGLGC